MISISINSSEHSTKKTDPQTPDLTQNLTIESPSTSEIINPHQKQSSIQYNVIPPENNHAIYYPMLEFQISPKERINEIELILKAVEHDRQQKVKHVSTFYIFSPPGLGKTMLGTFLARCYDCPYQIINCVNSMIDLDLLGSQVLVGTETFWQDGPLPATIKAANDYGTAVLIINELNALTVNAQMALNPLLDHQEGVILTQNNNEFVHIHPDSHLVIIAGMNPDVLGINDLQDSVRDRAGAIIYMDYPSLTKESWLIQQLTCLDEEWATKYCEVIAECRRAKSVDRTISKAPSTRALLDWIHYSKIWGPMLAFNLTIANRYGIGTSNEESIILQRLAAGKGVDKWQLPDQFCIVSDPLLQAQDLSLIFRRFYIKKSENSIHPTGSRKKSAQKRESSSKLAVRLDLKPLESYLSENNIPEKDKKST